MIVMICTYLAFHLSRLMQDATCSLVLLSVLSNKKSVSPHRNPFIPVAYSRITAHNTVFVNKCLKVLDIIICLNNVMQQCQKVCESWSSTVH